jgi:endonuclease G
MALLKVKQASNAGWLMPDPIPLADAEATDEELVGLVGYPAYDSRNDADAMHRYFKDLYDVKRFAPGYVIKQTAEAVLSHDCTSFGGNSGSVLISLEQKRAVGLHFAGEYGKSNSAVGVTTIKKLLKGSLVTVGQIPGGESFGTEVASEGAAKRRSPACPSLSHSKTSMMLCSESSDSISDCRSHNPDQIAEGSFFV